MAYGVSPPPAVPKVCRKHSRSSHSPSVRCPPSPSPYDHRCDTLEPVSTYASRSLAAVDPEESAPTVARSLQKWKENEKWRETEKWKGLEKWRRDYGTEVVHL